MDTLYIPALSEDHAASLFLLYRLTDDETALSMLNSGMIGRTREDAERFLTETVDPKYLHFAQVFEYPG